MPLDRDMAVALMQAYLPDAGPDGHGGIALGSMMFDHIARDYGSGTTCGFLPHWMLWRLGCSDTSLVNRFEPDGGFHYDNGQNIARLGDHRYFLPLGGRKDADALLRGELGPKPGDVVRDCYCVFFKGHRAYMLASARPGSALILRDAAYWLPGSDVTVIWSQGTESWSIATRIVAGRTEFTATGVTATGRPLSANLVSRDLRSQRMFLHPPINIP